MRSLAPEHTDIHAPGVRFVLDPYQDLQCLVTKIATIPAAIVRRDLWAWIWLALCRTLMVQQRTFPPNWPTFVACDCTKSLLLLDRLLAV